MYQQTIWVACWLTCNESSPKLLGAEIVVARNQAVPSYQDHRRKIWSKPTCHDPILLPFKAPVSLKASEYQKGYIGIFFLCNCTLHVMCEDFCMCWGTQQRRKYFSFTHVHIVTHVHAFFSDFFQKIQWTTFTWEHTNSTVHNFCLYGIIHLVRKQNCYKN